MDIKIRFYQDTISEEQIIELLKLDDNFKLDGKPVLKYYEYGMYDDWYDNSGSFDVFSNENVKSKSDKKNFIRLYPYVEFNDVQKALYNKFIYESFRIVKCPFYIVSNEEEQRFAEKELGEKIVPEYKVPFVVGMEKGRMCQEKKSTFPGEDYVDFDTREIYQYEIKQITTNIFQQ